MSGLPWSKFWWADWQSDIALKLCSLEAQGLWMQMLCIMAATPRVGFLEVNNAPVDEKSLAKFVGITTNKCKKLVEELRKNGVFSVNNEGVIYCRRMVREEEKSRKDKENGALGGNPRLVQKASEGVNPRSSIIQEAKKLEAKNISSLRSDTPSLVPPSDQKHRTVDPPPKPNRSTSDPKGHRLPVDWRPDPSLVTYASELGLNPDAVAEKFCDYWHAQPGAKARKLDWAATWRVWCRSEAERSQKPRIVYQRPQHPLEQQYDRMMRENSFFREAS